jgi:hypothetical protein
VPTRRPVAGRTTGVPSRARSVIFLQASSGRALIEVENDPEKSRGDFERFLADHWCTDQVRRSRSYHLNRQRRCILHYSRMDRVERCATHASLFAACSYRWNRLHKIMDRRHCGINQRGGKRREKVRIALARGRDRYSSTEVGMSGFVRYVFDSRTVVWRACAYPCGLLAAPSFLSKLQFPWRGKGVYRLVGRLVGCRTLNVRNRRCTWYW